MMLVRRAAAAIGSPPDPATLGHASVWFLLMFAAFAEEENAP
jgi:hypothetical protein